ncbi:MAG: superoxide dismutase family protein [Blastocatellia bacterium]|nr:superoxide dismutase family protein [Blastocatellia bacterium]
MANKNIVGRSIVIHAGEEKFTQPSGNAGGRVGFGKIEIEPTK